MIRMARKHALRGFSLLEITVALAVSSVIGLVVWQMYPRMQGIDAAQVAAQRTQTLASALEGFVLQHHRLPCPDAGAVPSGRESCASGAAVGWLPWQDLGVDARQGRGIRYGVYRASNASVPHDADLAAALLRYTPNLPALYTPSVTPVLNGLDFCKALRTAGATQGQAGALTAGGTEAAYALAHPGPDGVFQGGNVAGFDSPVRPVSVAGNAAGSYDDQVVAVGLFELAGRLGCPLYMGQAQASAAAAKAAEDMESNARFLATFRTFSREVRGTDVAFAGVSAAIATLDLAISTATSITAVSVAANSAGIGAGVAIPALLAVGASGVSLVVATNSLKSAIESLQKAEKQESELLLRKTEAGVLLAITAAEAIANDKKGLRP